MWFRPYTREARDDTSGFEHGAPLDAVLHRHMLILVYKLEAYGHPKHCTAAISELMACAQYLRARWTRAR